MSIKILIIEDDIFISSLFRESLEFYNINYKIANNGVEAYKILFNTTFETEFNYIITNIGLPDENGIEIIKFIKNYFTSKIIIYTGKNYNFYKNEIKYDFIFRKKYKAPSDIIKMIVTKNLI